MLYTNKYNLPQSIYDAISTQTYDLKKITSELYPISSLINPPIMRQLTLRHSQELEEDISENVWRLIGSAVHSVLERTHSDTRLIEERIRVEQNNCVITGKPDLYDGANKTIHDYKITSAWSILYKDEEDKQWEYQLNCYAWLYRHLNFEVDKLEIIAILRDWSKRKAQEDKKYPQLPIVIIQIPLWTFEQQSEFINKRLNEHLIAAQLKDDELPICTPKERWATEDTFAVYKNKNKTATRVFLSYKEAEAFIAGKPEYRIEQRKGVDKRCIDYCNIAKFCSYGKSICT